MSFQEIEKRGSKLLANPEHFIIIEMIRLSHYRKNDWQFFYLRTKDNAEIDLIVDRPGLSPLMIEIKSARSISERDVFTISLFIKEHREFEGICFSREPHEKKIGAIWCLPWEKAFQEIGLI